MPGTQNLIRILTVPFAGGFEHTPTYRLDNARELMHPELRRASPDIFAGVSYPSVDSQSLR